MGFPEEQVLLLLDPEIGATPGPVCQKKLAMAKRLLSYKGGLTSGPFE